MTKIFYLRPKYVYNYNDDDGDDDDDDGDDDNDDDDGDGGLIKSMNYVLRISDVHEILFVQLFILNISNKFDLIHSLSCQLIGSPTIFSACRCRRG